MAIIAGCDNLFKPAAKLEEIESHIEGRFDGWRPNQQIRLANGQVWRVVDDSEGITPLLSNPKVKVVRGTLVGHLATGVANKSDGFLRQARRKPQR